MERIDRDRQTDRHQASIKCEMHQARGEKCTRHVEVHVIQMVCLLFIVCFFYISSLLLLLLLLLFCFVLSSTQYIEMQKAMKNLEASHAWLSYVRRRKKIVHIISSVILTIPMRFVCVSVSVCVCFRPFYFNANSVRPMVYFFFGQHSCNFNL